MGIKESWNVSCGAEEENWKNVEPSLASVRGELERIADTKEPLNGDGQGHEDTAAHSNVAERVDEEGKKDCINSTASFKCSTSVVYSTTDDEDCVIASQRK